MSKALYKFGSFEYWRFSKKAEFATCIINTSALTHLLMGTIFFSTGKLRRKQPNMDQ